MAIIRNKIKLDPKEAVFLFCNKKMIAGHTIIASVYEENKDEDGFLYMTLHKENTFG